MVDEILNLVQICKKILDQKIPINNIWDKLSYLTTDLKKMGNVINKQRSRKKIGKLVSTEENNNNIRVETDHINDNIVKVLDDNKLFNKSIGLSILSESDEYEVNISFKGNRNYNRYDNENDNQNKSNNNDEYYNDNIVNNLA